mgnify:CR=1 FL=1|jgi:hypothetical protein
MSNKSSYTSIPYDNKIKYMRVNNEINSSFDNFNENDYSDIKLQNDYSDINENDYPTIGFRNDYSDINENDYSDIEFTNDNNIKLQNMNNNDNIDHYDKLLAILFNHKQELQKYKKLNSKKYKIRKYIRLVYVTLYLMFIGYLLLNKLPLYINNNCHNIIFNTKQPNNIECTYKDYDNFVLLLQCNNNQNYNLTINNQYFNIYKYFINNNYYNKIYECPQNNNLYFLNFNETFNQHDWELNCIYNYDNCYNLLLLITIGFSFPLLVLLLSCKLFC